MDVTAAPVVGVHVTLIGILAVLRPLAKAVSLATMSLPFAEILKLVPPTKAIFSAKSALAVQRALFSQLKKKFLNSLMTTAPVLETGRATVA